MKHTENRSLKKGKKNEQSICELWDNIKWPHIYTCVYYYIRVLYMSILSVYTCSFQNEKKWGHKIFEERMFEIFFYHNQIQ